MATIISVTIIIEEVKKLTSSQGAEPELEPSSPDPPRALSRSRAGRARRDGRPRGGAAAPHVSGLSSY